MPWRGWTSSSGGAERRGSMTASCCGEGRAGHGGHSPRLRRRSLPAGARWPQPLPLHPAELLRVVWHAWLTRRCFCHAPLPLPCLSPLQGEGAAPAAGAGGGVCGRPDVCAAGRPAAQLGQHHKQVGAAVGGACGWVGGCGLMVSLHVSPSHTAVPTFALPGYVPAIAAPCTSTSPSSPSPSAITSRR